MEVCGLGYDYCLWQLGDDLPPLEVGDRVALRPHDAKDTRGVLLGIDSPGLGIVRMDVDGKTRTVEMTPREIRQVFRLKSKGDGQLGRVLIVPETIDFRTAVRAQMMAEDVVVEFGSSYGDTSQLLARYVRKTIGVDCSPECCDEASRRHPQLTFILADVLRESELMRELCQGCDVVCIDIGGDRRVEDQLEMLRWAQRVAQPAFVLIKSRLLFRELRASASDCVCGPLPDMEAWLQGRLAGAGPDSAGRRRASRAGKRARKAAAAAATVGEVHPGPHPHLEHKE